MVRVLGRSLVQGAKVLWIGQLKLSKLMDIILLMSSGHLACQVGLNTIFGIETGVLLLFLIQGESYAHHSKDSKL